MFSHDALKINFDGATFEEGDKLGLGFTTKDFADNFLLVGSRTVWQSGSTEAARVRGLLWTVLVATSKGGPRLLWRVIA